MDNLSEHLQDRSFIITSLIEDVSGPSPIGKPRNLDDVFTWKEFPFIQENGQEIIWGDDPSNKYGVGVLYPKNIEDVEVDESSDPNDGSVPDFNEYPETDEINLTTNDLKNKKISGDDLDLDFDISATSKLKQSSFGVSVCVELENTKSIKINLPNKKKLTDYDEIEVNGIYRTRKIKVNYDEEAKNNEEVKDLLIYCRNPFSVDGLSFEVDLEILNSNQFFKKEFSNDLDGFNQLAFYVYPRSLPSTNVNEERKMILTFCLVNEVDNQSELSVVEKSLYQSFFEIEIESQNEKGGIYPYPSFKESYDNGEKSMELMYRNSHNFGVGHGCSAVWKNEMVQNNTIKKVSADFIPIFQDQSMTPDIFIPDEDQNELKISMYELMENDGIDKLSIMVDEYEKWIKKELINGKNLKKAHFDTLKIHMEKCNESRQRMTEGIKWIKSDKQALQSFKMMNKAMVMQRFLGTKLGVIRNNILTRDGNIFDADFPGYQSLEEIDKNKLLKYYWRPFQIAFILMALKSTTNGSDPFREFVDLIWFPTGGGKTEAYLGLSAFSIFYRRLKNNEDTGTQILMRYTLRLLTTQQFQRATKLICAMELIRRENSKLLGTTKFKIGLWVGQDSSPNKRDKAIQSLIKLKKNSEEPNKFILQCCPWCGSSFYQTSRNPNNRKNRKFIGCEPFRRTVVYNCRDSRCKFSGEAELPIFVIDEDIYEQKPDIIVGTVDKFANLIWNPDIRSIFGLDEDGNRERKPPGLIIQDELHLISGPLGSMCGFFETIIEELCTDRTNENPIKPKIVCSTATIRRFEDQIKNLFGRNKASLFPSSGSSYNDSFFSVIDDNKPGRLHVGLCLPGYHTSVSAQVKLFSSLQKNAIRVSKEINRLDPWWTLLVFYNSLIELGTGYTLFGSTVKAELRQAYQNSRGEYDRRYINNVDDGFPSYLISQAAAMNGLPLSGGGKWLRRSPKPI